MKKRYIYILLMALVGLGFTTACNDKEFYDYVKPDGASTSEEPYTLKLSVKMSAGDLARISEIDGNLSGMLLYIPPKTTVTTRVDQTKGAVDFKYNKGTDRFEASVLVMGVDKKAKQILTLTLKHTNGSVSTSVKDMTEDLSGMNHLTADAPIEMESQQITLPGSADDTVGGGSLNDWDDSTDVDGEAGTEINSANE